VFYFPTKEMLNINKVLEQSRIYEYSEGWNQYTNSDYFNSYTFFLMFSLCIIIGAIISLFKKNQKKDRMYQEEKTVEWDAPIPYL